MNEADRAANLAALRSKAHEALDALWRDGLMTRQQAYNWLARHMRMKPEDCHITKMDEQQCGSVIALARAKRRQMSFEGAPRRIRPHAPDVGKEAAANQADQTGAKLDEWRYGVVRRKELEEQQHSEDDEEIPLPGEPDDTYGYGDPDHHLYDNLD